MSDIASEIRDIENSFLCGTNVSTPVVPSLGLRVTEDRVLIRADREEHAPLQTDSGLYLAQTIAAAVDGSDTADSWFVGTIVQVGPLVNKLDVRSRVLKWLAALEEGYVIDQHDEPVVALSDVVALRERIEALPQEMPDPLKVGDRVTFSWAAGQQIAIEGEKYLILRASDVLGVLEE